VSEIDHTIDPRQSLLFSENNQEPWRADGFVVCKRRIGIGIAQETMGQTDRTRATRDYSDWYEWSKSRPPCNFDKLCF